MRALTAKQATACEHATSKRCRCRCGGRLHGAGRGEVVGLPAGDPHRVELLAGVDPVELEDLGDGLQLALFELGPPRAADRLLAARIRLAEAAAEREAMRMTRRSSRRLERRTDGANEDPRRAVGYDY